MMAADTFALLSQDHFALSLATELAGDNTWETQKIVSKK